jgi:hypothetical protein
MPSTVSELLSREIPNTLNWTGRFRLTAGVLVSFGLFFLACRTLDLPPVLGKSGSLLLQTSPGLAVGAVGGALLVSTLLGKLIVGELLLGQDAQFEGGLVAALIGMVAVIARIGPVRYALFQTDKPEIFLMLAAELMLLYGLVIVCWLILRATSARQHYPPESWASKLLATGTHVVVMAACMVFLAQSDATAQGVAAVGISAILASMAAHIAFPVRCSFWYWLSPVLVGAAGYAVAYCNPLGLAIGYPDGPLAGLARATPVAYAAAGPVGAIFGFWVAYRWNTGESGLRTED